MIWLWDYPYFYSISTGFYAILDKLQDVSKNVSVRLLGTRFTNAIDCFEPGPQEPYRNILKHCRMYMFV
jgi:hypothetical protein